MTTTYKLIEANPFPGLRAFATSEADRFFGRRQQIEELASRLDQVGFVAVAGSSGCGKSSLVLAGLLRELSHRTEAESKTIWHAVIMRPGNQPLVNLAQQLSAVISGGSDGSRARALYGQLRLGGLGLIEAVRLARLDAHTRVLIVVDQFEELFRFRRMIDADEASAFVKLLLHAANDQQSPVSVVITLRSDKLGYCDDFRDLPETVSRGQYLVPKLTREQRKQAIVEPVTLRGFHIAPRLVQRLLNDVSDDFDDLPVMQHALSRTWNRWVDTCQGDRPIDLEDYEAVGTSKDALSQHADEAFESLPQLAQVTEKVFRALTECLADGTEVRRGLPFDLLCQIVGMDREQVEQVVERFRRPDTAFLRPGQEVSLQSDPMIDISHESLIRLWSRLRKWAKEEAKSRETLERLIRASSRRLDPQPGSLWQGRELEETLEWRRNTNPTAAWVRLYTSEEGAVAWKSAEDFLTESHRKANRERLLRRLLIGGTCLLALAIVIVYLYWSGYTSKMTKSQAYASEALLTINQDPARSAHLALASLEHDSNNQLGVNALRQSLTVLESAHTERVLDLGEPVSDAKYSRDGSFLVTASGKTVAIFDTKDLTKKSVVANQEEVVRTWLLDNNKILVTYTADGRAQIQKIDDSSPHPISCEGEENPALTTSISHDEQFIALGCYDGSVLVWHVRSRLVEPTPIYSYKVKKANAITALAFSFDNKYLASGDSVGVINIWKLGYPTIWIGQDGARTKESPIKHGSYSAIRDIGFYRDDPALLVTAADDNRAIVWELDLEKRRVNMGAKNEHPPWFLPHERPVIAAKFTGSRDGIPVMTVSGKNTQLWENSTADPKQIRAHDDWVTDANASHDGEWLVTASSDGTARIWSTRSGAPIAALRGHKGEVYRAVFSPDGKQVVTAGADGTVRIWQFRVPQLLSASKRWVLSATFDPTGTRVAIGKEGGASILELNGTGSSSSPHLHDLPIREYTDTDQFAFMSWSRDGKFLVSTRIPSSGFDRRTPILWDVEHMREITPPWLNAYNGAVFGPGTDELLTIGRNGVAAWDLKSLSVDHPYPTYEFDEKPGLSGAAMSPDGKWIATSRGNKVKLWNRDNRRTSPRELRGHSGNIASLQFSRDSRQLLTAGSDRTARIWPIDGRTPPKELNGGHTARMASASFSADSRWVVTASVDGTTGVWNAETAEELVALHRHSEGVNSAEFSPDGKSILSASDDRTVILDQCESCALSIEELQHRVPILAKLSEHEMKEIHADSVTVTGLFHLPAFLSPSY